ncbi:MAG TPA: hypothetical protein VLI04_16170 [Nocardioidaceae bacterium]|nr:hypothetical protein [Nocardioidaceae bacterium]
MPQAFPVVAAMAFALSGCTFSSVDPDASVHISGRALDASGKPLAGAQVLLLKEADMGEVVFGGVLVLGTLSTVCLLPEAPAICDSAHSVTADSEGRYEFELKGSDTQGTLATESTLNVVLSDGSSASSTALSFTVKDTNVTLPDARMARLSPRVSVRSDQIELTWSPLPKKAGSDATYSARLFESDESTALWTQPATGSRASIDARILEDLRGTIAVGGITILTGGTGTGEVRAHYMSSRLSVRGTSQAPPSRGRPCAAVTGTATAKTGRFSSACGVTDGDLSTPARLNGRGVVAGVVVDLGVRRPVELVVPRGFAGQFLVEISDDGTTYRTVATSSGTAVALVVPGQPTARYVRLRSPAGLDESLSSELSIW